MHAFDDALAWVGAYAAHRAGTEAIFATVRDHAFARQPVALPVDTIGAIAPELLEAAEKLVNGVAGDTLRRTLFRAYAVLGTLVDKYFVTNEYDFQALQDLELVPPQKLEMIIGGDGVDLRRFDIDDEDFPSVEQARAQLDVPRGWRQVLGCAGPTHRAAELSDLVTSVERMAQTHPSVGWLVWLDTASARRVRRRLEAHVSAGRVIPVEESTDPSVFYRALDGFVSPGYGSEAARRLMEAAATKVGAIAYQLPATESIIEQGQTGQLVPAGDAEALVEAVREALDDPKRLDNYGVRARARAVRKFNRQHVEDQVFRMYDTVLEMRLDRSEGG